MDAGATLRDRFRFGAGLGLCSPAAGDDNPLVLSASASAQLFGGDRERFDVVAQLGIARYSMDESTVLLVLVVVGAGLDLNEHVTAYAGPVFHYARTSRGEGEFFYSTSDKRLGGLAGLQLAHRTTRRPQRGDHRLPRRGRGLRSVQRRAVPQVVDRVAAGDVAPAPLPARPALTGAAAARLVRGTAGDGLARSCAMAWALDRAGSAGKAGRRHEDPGAEGPTARMEPESFRGDRPP